MARTYAAVAATSPAVATTSPAVATHTDVVVVQSSQAALQCHLACGATTHPSLSRLLIANKSECLYCAEWAKQLKNEFDRLMVDKHERWQGQRQGQGQW